MRKKVLVAMSGGVDSSVAAHLLLEGGYEVIGATMCLGIPDPQDSDRMKCCGTQAIDDARAVCGQLQIPHYVLDFSRQMKEYIINNFVAEYLNARTPNPCVRCNEYLKFGKLFDYAKNMGCDFFATGHYARIEERAGACCLCRGRDQKKDQSYFLYSIDREKLSSILFPLGEYRKDQVREIAQNARLKVARKPQSQDICFITGKNYKEFIMNYANDIVPGEIVTRDGEVLGTHQGIIHYTLGQREGLRVAVGRPLYVSELDARTNQVVVGDKEDLYANVVDVHNMNYLVSEMPKQVKAQIRYAHVPSSCTFISRGQEEAQVLFSDLQEAVTPGQSLVLYHDDVVCGGGVIQSARCQEILAN